MGNKPSPPSVVVTVSVGIQANIRLSNKKASVSHFARNNVVLSPVLLNFARSCAFSQKRQITGFGERIFAPPQPPSPMPSRSGSAKAPPRMIRCTTAPPNIPSPMAENVLAKANLKPITPAVNKNIDGSIIGDASQKAITAESGIPIARSAAINGITPQEQNGERPPASAPRTTIKRGAPVKALAIKLSAPVALAQAATAMDRNRKGAVFSSALPAKTALSRPCNGSITARINSISADTSQTRCSCQIYPRAEQKLGMVKDV